MKERLLSSAMVADDQTGCPDDFVLWIALDKSATIETGILHLCQIPIPESFSPVLESMIDRDTLLEVTIEQEIVFTENMMGLECKFIQILPFMVGIRNQ